MTRPWKDSWGIVALALIPLFPAAPGVSALDLVDQIPLEDPGGLLDQACVGYAVTAVKVTIHVPPGGLGGSGAAWSPGSGNKGVFVLTGEAPNEERFEYWMAGILEGGSCPIFGPQPTICFQDMLGSPSFQIACVGDTPSSVAFTPCGLASLAPPAVADRLSTLGWTCPW